MEFFGGGEGPNGRGGLIKMAIQTKKRQEERKDEKCAGVRERKCVQRK